MKAWSHDFARKPRKFGVTNPWFFWVQSSWTPGSLRKSKTPSTKSWTTLSGWELNKNMVRASELCMPSRSQSLRNEKTSISAEILTPLLLRVPPPFKTWGLIFFQVTDLCFLFFELWRYIGFSKRLQEAGDVLRKGRLMHPKIRHCILTMRRRLECYCAKW